MFEKKKSNTNFKTSDFTIILLKLFFNELKERTNKKAYIYFFQCTNIIIYRKKRKKNQLLPNINYVPLQRDLCLLIKLNIPIKYGLYNLIYFNFFYIFFFVLIYCMYLYSNKQNKKKMLIYCKNLKNKKLYIKYKKKTNQLKHLQVSIIK